MFPISGSQNLYFIFLLSTEHSVFLELMVNAFSLPTIWQTLQWLKYLSMFYLLFGWNISLLNFFFLVGTFFKFSDKNWFWFFVLHWIETQFPNDWIEVKLFGVCQLNSLFKLSQERKEYQESNPMKCDCKNFLIIPERKVTKMIGFVDRYCSDSQFYHSKV